MDTLFSTSLETLDSLYLEREARQFYSQNQLLLEHLKTANAVCKENCRVYLISRLEKKKDDLAKFDKEILEADPDVDVEQLRETTELSIEVFNSQVESWMAEFSKACRMNLEAIIFKLEEGDKKFLLEMKKVDDSIRNQIIARTQSNPPISIGCRDALVDCRDEERRNKTAKYRESKEIATKKIIELNDNDNSNLIVTFKAHIEAVF